MRACFSVSAGIVVRAPDIRPDAVSGRNGIGNKAGITLSDAIEKRKRIIRLAAQ